jgi:hypothetical protein
MVLVDRPCPGITVALVNDFGHGRNRDIQEAKELASCPLLPEGWQHLVVQRAIGKEW